MQSNTHDYFYLAITMLTFNPVHTDIAVSTSKPLSIRRAQTPTKVTHHHDEDLSDDECSSTGSNKSLKLGEL